MALKPEPQEGGQTFKDKIRAALPLAKLERLKDSLTIDKSRLSQGIELRNHQRSALANSSHNQHMLTALKFTGQKAHNLGGLSNRSVSRDKSPFAQKEGNLLMKFNKGMSYQDIKADLNAFRSVSNFR